MSARVSAVVIEDDADIRELMLALLRRWGHDAHGAPTGEAGFALVQKLRPAIIIVDLRLPGIDGWEVVRRLREDTRTATIPVLVVSVLDPGDNSAHPNVAGYLVKPILPKQLEAAVRRIIAAHPAKPTKGAKRWPGSWWSTTTPTSASSSP
jgi:DNA-binding response OmpR family regulator